MKDQSKTKQALIQELASLKRKIKELEQSESSRKRAEEALRESEEKYRSVVETTRDMIYATDRKGFLTYINPTLEKTLGYTKDEWNGKSFAQQIVAPECNDKARDIFRRAMHGESIPVYEIDLIRKDGTRLSVEVNVSTIYDHEGKPAGRYGIGRDITERKQAEEALKESEAKYRSLLDHASDAILLADIQGNIVEANRKAVELWGWTKEELLQMHYTQLHPMPEMERTIAAFQKIIEKNTDHLSGGSIQRKDGNIFPVDITCNVIEYAGRKVIQGSFRDISEHIRSKDLLEKLVRERTAELARNNEQLKLEVKERKHAEAAMKKKTSELKQHTDKLNELNTALRVLLKQREDDKNDLEEKVTSNVKELLLPYIEGMKNRKIDPKSKVSLSILETNLQNIISPFTQRLSSKYLGLTPREVQVADLIRQGKSTKEIARFIGVSASAISIYRYHIREKLGLIEQKINLKTYLQNLS